MKFKLESQRQSDLLGLLCGGHFFQGTIGYLHNGSTFLTTYQDTNKERNTKYSVYNTRTREMVKKRL